MLVLQALVDGIPNGEWPSTAALFLVRGGAKVQAKAGDVERPYVASWRQQKRVIGRYKKGGAAGSLLITTSTCPAEYAEEEVRFWTHTARVRQRSRTRHSTSIFSLE
ncbi:MAG: hypothetical protein OEY56_09395 [Cyclobacteriaceae bacterium]|nr:hypothetical protein [Cyclobacteriaceae bacterium]